MSCTSDTSTEIKFDYTINSIDIVNNQMDVTFTITNSTKVDLDEQNWSLHWNQILGSPVQGSLPDGIDFEWVNGNSYFIFYFGKKWSVLAGERISFNVKTSGVVSRLDFGPKGAFVVSGGKTIDVKNTIHWENAKGLAQLNLPTAKSRFEKEWKLDNEVCQTYYLDLITFRPISNEIAEKTGVEHQSPQVIVLKNKEVIYQASHNGIDANEIQALFKK